MVDKEDWCISHNQPEATCFCQQQPKCIRVLVTAMFADNSSVMIDVKSPAEFDIDWNTVGDNVQLGPNYEVVSSPTILDMRVKAQLSKEEPAIVSYYPSKWRG